MNSVSTRIEEVIASHGGDVHGKKVSKEISTATLRKKNWVHQCLYVSLGLNSQLLSVL